MEEPLQSQVTMWFIQHLHLGYVPFTLGCPLAHFPLAVSSSQVLQPYYVLVDAFFFIADRGVIQALNKIPNLKGVVVDTRGAKCCIAVVPQLLYFAIVLAVESGKATTSHQRVRYSVITNMNLLPWSETGNGPMRFQPTLSKGSFTMIDVNDMPLDCELFTT